MMYEDSVQKSRRQLPADAERVAKIDFFTMNWQMNEVRPFNCIFKDTPID